MRLILLLFLDAVLLLFRGFVLKTLWNWFIVPQFGVPALGIVSAIGIGIAMSMFTSKISEKSDEELNKMVGRIFSRSMIQATAALITGWITLQFM